MLARVSWIWVLVGWTVFLWISRLRNVVNNEELTDVGRGVRVGVVGIFVALAIATAWAHRRQRPAIPAVFIVWTVGYWLVRGIGILIDGDYSVGFKAVHTVLMAVSLTLSFLAARQLQQRR